LDLLAFDTQGSVLLAYSQLAKFVAQWDFMAGLCVEIGVTKEGSTNAVSQ
jgi:hypothetical protein